MASWGPEPGLLASAHGSFPMGSRRVLVSPRPPPWAFLSAHPGRHQGPGTLQGTREP